MIYTRTRVMLAGYSCAGVADTVVECRSNTNSTRNRRLKGNTSKRSRWHWVVVGIWIMTWIRMWLRLRLRMRITMWIRLWIRIWVMMWIRVWVTKCIRM